MNKIIRIVILILVSLPGYAQLGVNGTEITGPGGNPFIINGISLGGWMVQEGRMMNTEGIVPSQHELRAKIEELVGPDDTDLFYTNWQNNYVTKSDIDYLKIQGFNVVRIPLHYNLFTLSVEDEPVQGENTWIDRGLTLTDKVVQWCAANQMYVILELQAAPGGQTLDEQSDYDSTNPSFWENTANQDKTIALWQRIAEHYAGNNWVAGYDLLKAPAQGGQTLLDIYEDITDAIRQEDAASLIFVQGKDGVDFTGLTTPFDSKQVYNIHRRQVLNNQASVEDYITLRNTANAPVYVGESKPNSNVWLRNMVVVLEDNNIGWSIWPLKQVDVAAGPMSTDPYINFQRLIDYWSGKNGPPTYQVARSILLNTANGLNFNVVEKHPDVLDALFRQPDSNEAVPYKVQNIPGTIYPTDFDMGTLGSSYFDEDTENLVASSGASSFWNAGRMYRNDGVDIELSEDDTHTNGYNLAYLGNGEWFQMSINVNESAYYNIEARVSSTFSGGKFQLSTGGSELTYEIEVPLTGDWQTWTSVVIENVALSTMDEKLSFHVVREGFNIGSLTFTKVAESNSVNANYHNSVALDSKTIRVDLTKPVVGPVTNLTDFEVMEGTAPLAITAAQVSDNGRSVVLTLSEAFNPMETIIVNHVGSTIKAADGTSLAKFTNKYVTVNLPVPMAIPGKIEAEDYFYASGIRLEDTEDGQGQNIGWLSPNDYVDYYIDVPAAGTYTTYFRTAAPSEVGVLKVDIADGDGTFRTLGLVSFQPTGDWQDFNTTRALLDLPEGIHQIRFSVISPNFNLNWFRFESGIVTSNEDLINELKVAVFPNPAASLVVVEGRKNVPQDVRISLVNLQGKLIMERTFEKTSEFSTTFETGGLATGMYLVRVEGELGEVSTSKLIIRN